jgi:radical SAM protein with 4Fe4S-binding SPASM domain
MIEQETTKHEIDAFIQQHYQNADIVSINTLEYVSLPNNAYGYTRQRKPLKSCVRIDRKDCIIHSNGVVSVCDADYNTTMGVGNINEQSLYEIWNGSERKHILDLNAQGRMKEIPLCEKCTDYDMPF